ncbi:multicopper oxidase domain-containing protein [Breoghania sp.]|uniref:multicopper oxidase domain-containing protein n=1 Tax=Breoghania sp. TaxID=2065378 RepID=UPI00260C7BC6|nr:multicopper oxidase domain-containing protein [Breoghania sp.]MDJ0930567.1 multicopper oxidase domain-containing protein [Breoghania sp.]
MIRIAAVVLLGLILVVEPSGLAAQAEAAGTSMYQSHCGVEHSAFVVALDGMPMEEPEPAGRMVLAPTQRIDLVVDVSGDAPALMWSDQSIELAGFTVSGSRQATRAEPGALPPNEMSPLSLKTAVRARLSMTGGMMGKMGRVHLRDDGLSSRQAMREGYFWAFNGRVDVPEDPLLSVGVGETAVVEMVNDTSWPHAMHLHGQYFRVIKDGAMSPWRDTVLTTPGETVQIAFVGANPGKWLLHCHMLTHAATGMLTWLKVA